VEHDRWGEAPTLFEKYGGGCADCFSMMGPFLALVSHVGAYFRVDGDALMTSGHTGTLRDPSDGVHWGTTVASLVVGAAFLALWFWLLPSWQGFDVDTAGAARWRWIAAVPSVLGFALAVRCTWDFGSTGHGTPAPMAPPQRLVVMGPYRYLRNPMYLGFLAGWIGLWVIFGRASVAAIAWACVVLAAVALFVVLYEQPTLRRKFGADYEEYCRNVRAWIPRMHPWVR